MENISFCSVEDIEKLQKFIHEKWKENHILSIDKRLMDFQHKSGNKYNFVIAKNSKDEITAVLGFIPLSQYDVNLQGHSDLWLALWKVDESSALPGIGFTLLKWLEEEMQPRSIGAIGINKNVKKIYDILGYKTGVLNQFYILNPFIKEYHIAKGDFDRATGSRPKSSSTIEEIQLDNIETVDFLHSPIKSKAYFENRYLKHPSYNYFLLGAYTNDVLQAVFVVRRIEVKQSACLRIIDIQGKYANIGSVEDSFISILQRYNSEYIDCLNYGIPEQQFIDWGFNLRNQQTIIPNYFEPFLDENVDILFAYKSEEPDYVIFKGDGDQDRPSVL